jgi:CheY-like chemotaxis protein
MNAILGFAELLDHHVTTERQAYYLSSIRAAGKTLLSLINDILDLSRIEAGKLELKKDVINPRLIFTEIRNIFSEKINEKKLEFIMEIDPTLTEGLVLDEVRIREILFNLVGNAVKFTDQGRIQLTVKKHTYKNDPHSIELTILIRDTGIGIPRDQLAFIFDAFRQVEQKNTTRFRGTGLGLSITKHLVEMMGGEITVESNPGSGSTFRVVLKKVPVAVLSEKAPEPESESARWETVHFHKAGVLIADDVVSNRELLKGFLTDSDLTVFEAENGQEAVEYAREYKPDLVLMDLKMPVMDGYEAIRAFKGDKALQSIPILVFTASVMKDEEMSLEEAACDGYLKKPIHWGEFVSQLKRFLPHTVLGGGKEKPPAGAKLEIKAPIPEETRAGAAEVFPLLRDELSDKCEKVKNRFIIDEIESFAVEIKTLGTQYKLPLLTDWGEKLFREIQSFDMEQLPKTLDSFSRLVKEIEMLL